MRMAALLVAVVVCLASAGFSTAVLIKPYSAQSNCLTAVAPGADMSLLPASSCSGAANQNWALDVVPNLNFYTFYTGLSSSCSPKVIEAQGTANAAAVTQVEFNPTHKGAYWNQISLTSPVNLAQSGYFFYQNVGSGRCLTADVAGNPVTTWDCGSTSTHQLWDIHGNSGSAARNQLFSANCLDVKSGSSGAPIITKACDSSSISQQFTTTSNNPIMLHNAGTGKCVDGGVQYILGTYQYSCVPTAGNQQWMPIKFPYENNPDGFVYFFNMFSGLCLSLFPANLADTASVACQEGNANQQWLIV